LQTPQNPSTEDDLPVNWTRVVKRGQVAYKNAWTGEVIGWRPTERASIFKGGLLVRPDPNDWPRGWDLRLSFNRPNAIVYVNLYTGEKISWKPTAPASYRRGNVGKPPVRTKPKTSASSASVFGQTIEAAVESRPASKLETCDVRHVTCDVRPSTACVVESAVKPVATDVPTLEVSEALMKAATGKGFKFWFNLNLNKKSVAIIPRNTTNIIPETLPRKRTHLGRWSFRLRFARGGSAESIDYPDH
jgi:hypothetical protein